MIRTAFSYEIKLLKEHPRILDNNRAFAPRPLHELQASLLKPLQPWPGKNYACGSTNVFFLGSGYEDFYQMANYLEMQKKSFTVSCTTAMLLGGGCGWGSVGRERGAQDRTCPHAAPLPTPKRVTSRAHKSYRSLDVV